MNDYGEFYADDLFKTTLYPHFDEGHKTGARELVDKLLKQCNGITDLPKITTIIDIGCGEGTLLAEIKKCLEETKAKFADEDTPVIKRWIGFDCSEKAIIQAKEQHPKSEIDFRHNDSDIDWQQLFDDLKVDDWSCTALTCFSHSWFHIQNEQMLRAAIKRFRPALLVIDLWHSCDKTVKHARSISTFFEESLKIGEFKGKPGNFFLRTEKQSDALIRRGICFRGTEGEAQWLFETVQKLQDTTALFGSPEELSQLDTALLAGSITGANGCDYIMARKFRHDSGWGEMDCRALVPRDPIGKELNKEYFDVIRNIPKLLFVNDDGKKSYEHLRKLLEAFDEVENTKLEVRRNNGGMLGDREVTVVLPFDPQRCFARALSLFQHLDDSTIANYDFILELPNDFQMRFPTGYGHFQTLLSRVSSQQAFPLSWAYDYKRKPVDEKYGELETPNLLFREKVSDTTLATRSHESTDKPAFFLLPVYWGSLPFFVLVLKFPPRFPIASTDAQVYQSALQNLHRQIKLTFTHAFLSNQILHPFISRSLDALHQLFNPHCNHTKEGVCEVCNSSVKRDSDGKLEPGICDYCRCNECGLEGVSAHLGGGKHGVCERIEFYLNLIRERLDGQKDWDAEFNENHLTLGGVLGGRWKSWLLTIPSIPIKELESTKAENRVLIQLFRDEARRVLLNHELRISYWFQEGGFFDADTHDQWRKDEHTNSLNKMLTIAGVQDESTVRDKINNVPWQGYFKRSIKQSEAHFLLEWTLGTMRKLFSDKTSEEEKQLYFNDLKAAFCKTWENKGEGMRFSWLRLWVHLDAAKGNKEVSISPRLIIDEKTNPTWYKSKTNDGPDMRYFCTDDPTVLIGEICAALAEMELLESIGLSISNWSHNTKIHCGEGVVSLTLKSPLRKEIGGANCMKLRHYVNLLWRRFGIGSDCDEWMYGHKLLTIAVKVEQIERVLKFILKPDSGGIK